MVLNSGVVSNVLQKQQKLQYSYKQENFRKYSSGFELLGPNKRHILFIFYRKSANVLRRLWIIYRFDMARHFIINRLDILSLTHRRRSYTEEKAKVVAVSCGTEMLQFLAALAILHQDVNELKNSGQIRLFFNSNQCKIASAARN